MTSVGSVPGIVPGGIVGRKVAKTSEKCGLNGPFLYLFSSKLGETAK